MNVTGIWLMIGGEILCIVCLIIILIVIVVKNKKKKKLQAHMADQARNDQLRMALENPHAVRQLKDEMAKNTAYQVDYHDAYQQTENTRCVQLTEYSPLSTRNYIFHIRDLIRIGNGPGNELVLHNYGGGDCEVQLIRGDDRLYVKQAMASMHIYLWRDKKKYLLDERMLILENEDVLVIGNTSIQIHTVLA